jgi:hypothetical protein
MDHVHELVHLRNDLVESVGISNSSYCHAGKLAIHGGGNHERVDVVAAAGKNLGDSREHAGFVGYVDAQGVGVFAIQ